MHLSYVAWSKQTRLLSFSRTLPFDHFFFLADAPPLVLARKSLRDFLVSTFPPLPLASFFFGGIANNQYATPH